MSIPASCPMCGSPRSQFKRSRSTGRAKCDTCGEVFEPDEEHDDRGSALAAPRPRTRSGGGRQEAFERVQGPAIYLIVIGALALLVNVCGIILGVTLLATIPEANFEAPEDRMTLMIQTGLSPIGLIVNGVVLFGGIQMRKLESLGFVQVAAALCAIPCCNGCAILGSPGGIWALVVLNEEDVSRHFR